MNANDDAVLSIGAAAKLSGVPAETLRTWERRYDLVVPDRDARGRRVYTRAQVEHLRSVGRLAAAGGRVAELAQLTREELAQRALQLSPIGVARAERVRVAVVHPAIGTSLSGFVEDLGIHVEVVTSGDDPFSLSMDRPVDVLLADVGSLGDAPAQILEQLEQALVPKQVVLTYHYLSKDLRRKLERGSTRLLRGPTRRSELRRVVADVGLMVEQVEEDPAPVPQRFERPLLEKLMNLSADRLCECPNHVASLVMAVQEFESYSRTCEEESPEERDMHRHLGDTAASVRVTLERLLLHICEHDGIDLEQLEAT
jgi:DNA-binding transcriptional MerR regulator